MLIAWRESEDILHDQIRSHKHLKNRAETQNKIRPKGQLYD